MFTLLSVIPDSHILKLLGARSGEVALEACLQKFASSEELKKDCLGCLYVTVCRLIFSILASSKMSRDSSTATVGALRLKHMRFEHARLGLSYSGTWPVQARAIRAPVIPGPICG